MFSDCTTITEAKQRWRELSRKYHPDLGGDADMFHRAKQEYEEIIKYLTVSIRCPVCGGHGKYLVNEGGGFASIEMICSICKGTGKTTRGEST